MSNTSATGGYLAPEGSPASAVDAAHDAQLQALVAGVTGLAGNLVRPRWQPTVPKQPEPDVDWCAIGVTTSDSSTFAVIEHVSTGDGSDTFRRHETLEILCSFYGPNCRGLAARLRDGLQVPQNREVMRAQGMAFAEASRIVALPEFVNQQWIRRADITVILRRQVDRVYPVLNVLEAVGTIRPDADRSGTPFDTANHRTGV